MNKVTQFTLALLFCATCVGHLEAMEKNTSERDPNLSFDALANTELTNQYVENLKILINDSESFSTNIASSVQSASTRYALVNTLSPSCSSQPAMLSSRPSDLNVSNQIFIDAFVKTFETQSPEFQAQLTLTVLNSFVGQAENMGSQYEVTQKSQNIAAVEFVVSQFKTRHSDYAPAPQSKPSRLLSLATGFDTVKSDAPTSAIDPRKTLEKAMTIATAPITISSSESSESETRYVHRRYDGDESKHSSSSSSSSSSSASNNNSRRSSNRTYTEKYSDANSSSTHKSQCQFQ